MSGLIASKLLQWHVQCRPNVTDEAGVSHSNSLSNMNALSSLSLLHIGTQSTFSLLLLFTCNFSFFIIYCFYVKVKRQRLATMWLTMFSRFILAHSREGRLSDLRLNSTLHRPYSARAEEMERAEQMLDTAVSRAFHNKALMFSYKRKSCFKTPGGEGR